MGQWLLCVQYEVLVGTGMLNRDAVKGFLGDHPTLPVSTVLAD